jgi:hypothetical protein
MSTGWAGACLAVLTRASERCDQGNDRLGRQWPRLPANAEADTGVMPAAVRIDQGSKLLVQSGGVGA